ncbi:hypothetical protein ACHAXS_001783 [Conticribra weissflogii]
MTASSRPTPIPSSVPINLLLLLTQILPYPSQAHSRWKCPPPRSSSTGIKTGPCGSETNDFGLSPDDDGDQPVTEIYPGPLRVIFEESIHHTGAPFRISLSGDGTDDLDASCVLLDHIPHNDCCRPNLYDESTYTPYVITINIPNVNCERCSLQLANPMTDKIGGDGSPTGIGCTDPLGTCFSVYHSCTRPFRIVGNGEAVARSDYQCEQLPGDWPTVWVGDNGVSVDATVPGLYRRESSSWSEVDFTLTTVPVDYVKDAGGICGDEGLKQQYTQSISSSSIKTTTTATHASSTSAAATTSTDEAGMAVTINESATSFNETVTTTSLPENSMTSSTLLPFPTISPPPPLLDQNTEPIVGQTTMQSTAFQHCSFYAWIIVSMNIFSSMMYLHM